MLGGKRGEGQTYFCDTDAFQYRGQVIRDETVAGALGENGREGGQNVALAVARSSDHLAPPVLCGRLPLQVQHVADLGKFLMDQRIVFLTVGMVLSEYGLGFVVSSFAD